MTLAADEFIRRFLLHVLPRGFHRIRHYGLLASAGRADTLARARTLIAAASPSPAKPQPAEPAGTTSPSDARPPCRCCGGRMVMVEVFARSAQPRAPPAPVHPTGTMAP